MREQVVDELSGGICCVESTLAASDRVRVGLGSERCGEFGERGRDGPMSTGVDPEFKWRRRRLCINA